MKFIARMPMIKKTTFVLIALISLPLIAQEGGFQSVADIEFVNQVADAPMARVKDAVGLFAMFYGNRKSDFQNNVALLRSKGISLPEGMQENDPLRRGMLALLAAQYLHLGDSFMYRIFHTKRHAVTACVASGIMEVSGSEWDMLSGGELVEVIRKVAEKAGGDR